MFVRVTKARELSGLSRKEWAQLLSDGLLAIYRPLPGTALVKLKDLRRALETNRWPAANPADKKGSRRRPRQAAGAGAST